MHARGRVDGIPEQVRVRIGALRDDEPSNTGLMSDGRAYVCSDYAPGPPMDQYVATQATARDAVKVLIALCGLIADLHGRGVVHGAIKAQNVIVVASPVGPVAAVLDAGVRPAIEASLSPRVNRRAAAGGDDLGALHRLASELLDSRTDLSAIALHIRRNPSESVSPSAADLGREMQSALGHR